MCIINADVFNSEQLGYDNETRHPDAGFSHQCCHLFLN